MSKKQLKAAVEQGIDGLKTSKNESTLYVQTESGKLVIERNARLTKLGQQWASKVVYNKSRVTKDRTIDFTQNEIT